MATDSRRGCVIALTVKSAAPNHEISNTSSCQVGAKTCRVRIVADATGCVLGVDTVGP